MADDPPPPLVHLEAFRVAGRAWVASDAAGRPVAYLVALELDGALHVEQVSVHPGHARRGVGARLLEHLAGVGRERGVQRLTLTTFRDVPWNAPYYARLGWRVLAPDAQGPELARLVAVEARALPTDAPRVAMERSLQDPPAPAHQRRERPPGGLTARGRR